MWRGLGLEPPPFAGCYEHLYLDIYPASLQPARPDYLGRVQPCRPIAYDVADGAHAAQVALPAGPDNRPLIYLTTGTVFTNVSALRQAIDGLASLEARLLVTVGPGGDPADLGDQPAHVRVERYVPQTLVLQHCDVIISHGGSGTVLAALAGGVPQLCLPQGADQFLNAAAIADAGAGLTIAPAEVDGAAIRRDTGRLLDDPQFRQRAGQIAEEIAAMPGPDDVAAVLEQLA
jgi:MGT family glycosyltransferase